MKKKLKQSINADPFLTAGGDIIFIGLDVSQGVDQSALSICIGQSIEGSKSVEIVDVITGVEVDTCMEFLKSCGYDRINHIIPNVVLQRIWISSKEYVFEHAGLSFKDIICKYRLVNLAIEETLHARKASGRSPVETLLKEDFEQFSIFGLFSGSDILSGFTFSVIGHHNNGYQYSIVPAYYLVGPAALIVEDICSHGEISLGKISVYDIFRICSVNPGSAVEVYLKSHPESLGAFNTQEVQSQLRDIFGRILLAVDTYKLLAHEENKNEKE